MRSSRQSPEAVRFAARRCCASSRAFSETHAPRFRYDALNASCDSSVVPRSILHSLAAIRLSCFVGFAIAPAGSAITTIRPVAIAIVLRIWSFLLSLTSGSFLSFV